MSAPEIPAPEPPAPESLAPSRSDATRAALVSAALDLFGAKGFEAASTREIAAAAGANIAAIAYHFGGKEGLRLACADLVAETIQRIAANASAAAGEPEGLTPPQARAALERLAGAMVEAIVVQGQGRTLARFVMREMFEPSEAFERLYGAFGPLHARACAVWARATGAEAGSEATRLAVFAMLAQIVYFRIARPAVLRRMEWKDIGAREGEAIRRAVVGNLAAALDRAGRAGP